MALIKCKECGRKISNKAKKCPHCGVTLIEKEKTNKNLKIILIATLIIIIVGVMSFLYSKILQLKKDLIILRKMKIIRLSSLLLMIVLGVITL